MRKDERKANENTTTEGVIRCREKISEMVNQIENEKFLSQIVTILKKHIEKRGD